MTARGYSRLARVNQVVQEVLADELERLGDPRLELVTVTGVEVSADLKHARVFYAWHAPDVGVVEGGTEASGTQEVREETASALEAARRPLQAALGRQVRLKYVPRLVFEEDQGVIEGQRIEQIIRQLHEGEP